MHTVSAQVKHVPHVRPAKANNLKWTALSGRTIIEFAAWSRQQAGCAHMPKTPSVVAAD